VNRAPSTTLAVLATSVALCGGILVASGRSGSGRGDPSASPTRVAVASSGVVTDPGAVEPPGALAAAETGTLVGTIRYRYDPQRRWRYGRYYVRGQSDGELAEAVVALTFKPGTVLPPLPATMPATTTIDQKDFRFVPETIALRAGDKVRFTNSDEQVHNVASSGALDPFDVTLAGGKESLVPFERAGGIGRPAVIGCRFHSAMRAWIHVFDHPCFALTGPDGTFRLERVPVGMHRLEVRHPAGSLRWSKPVRVEPGDPQRIDVLLGPDDVVE
jgi:plastocyanin